MPYQPAIPDRMKIGPSTKSLQLAQIPALVAPKSSVQRLMQIGNQVHDPLECLHPLVNSTCRPEHLKLPDQRFDRTTPIGTVSGLLIQAIALKRVDIVPGSRGGYLKPESEQNACVLC